MFNAVDKDGDGNITEAELGEVLQCMGYYAKEATYQAHQIMKNVDTDGDGQLSFEEFSHVHASIQLSSDEVLIHTCFQVMDDNGDGQISIQELKVALNLTDSEAQIAFEEADINKDGVISFDEFKLAMSSGFQRDKIDRDELVAGFCLQKDESLPVIEPSRESSSTSKVLQSKYSCKSNF
ncbi:calmodulin-like protein [Reticulomyxa filosa]|uniref:Calmodulin-like protein n=1 Tax=Reticulomyxa filosa TaxID=46433 RepID=X6NU01_RETFI|nr:calmodulin-like protein [Reticulomyxa filosa]|eukprot:ETO29398.1 calmodulin-like protein [Reticulomyxa filosa]